MTNNFYENHSFDTMYLQTCHSQGAIPTRNDLLDYPENLRKRMFVVAVVPQRIFILKLAQMLCII
ncbi:hypothetical protein PHSC3_000701 [Chlamydiales bacterium STE3]|nr:hypothetical protein PHSC3_000701 [Chlamydiales bacterium STE3]